MQKRLLISVAIVAALAAGAVAFYYYWSMYEQSGQPETPVPQPSVVQEQSKAEEPKRTEFAGTKPDGFPSEIPIEEGAAISQSYSVEYDTQKQYVVAFSTKKTVAENRSLYADFFAKDSWVVLNKYEDDAAAVSHVLRENIMASVAIVSGQVNINVTTLGSSEAAMEVPSDDFISAAKHQWESSLPIISGN